MYLVVRLEPCYGGLQKIGRLVEEASCEELLVLYRFAKIVLKHAAMAVLGGTNNDIAQANIVLSTGRSATDANHRTDSDAGKTAHHVGHDFCSRD